MNLRPAVEAFARTLPPPRVIPSRNSEGPYLSRYYIAGRERLDDRDRPWARMMEQRRVLIPTKHHGVYLHHIHQSDSEPELHSHPWRWALALILVGGYVEERRRGDKVLRRYVLPGHWNLLRADTFHRVTLLEEDAWSLFITGPKPADDWEFWNRDTGVSIPWLEFGRRVRAGTHFRPHTGMPHAMVEDGPILFCSLCGLRCEHEETHTPPA